LSLIYDNSLWTYTGPIDGIRANITGGITFDFAGTRVLNRLFLADLRHYYRLGAQSAFSTRLYTFLSGGREPVRRYFGGSWDFRGFDRRAFYVRKILFASNELRFPLINRLAIDSPLGRLNFSGIKGALFVDLGSAWDREDPQWYASYGFGWRVALGYLVTLRFDFAQTTDFKSLNRGLEFDFFFGWDF
jgi:outer membrane protein assembly factor BamA